MEAIVTRRLSEYRGVAVCLKQQPNLYMGNPPLTIGKEYTVKDVEGSNFWICDDEGNPTSIGSCRFDLS